MSEPDLHLVAENVGGIDECEFATDEGVTLVAGPNATNKTSMLRAVLFGVGADEVTIRTDAEEARVALSIHGERVERRAQRSGDKLAIDGDGLVTDERETILLEQFAGLLQTNELRRAIERGDDVGPLLTRPLDVDRLKRERSEKLGRKRSLEREIASLEETDEQLAAARADRTDAIDRREQLEADIANLQDQRRSDDDELDELRERRAGRVAERDRIRARVEELEAAVDRLDDRVTERRQELERAQSAATEADAATLESERERLQSELDEIEDRLEILQSVVSTNREMLDSQSRGALGFEATLSGDEVTCWTCGTDVQLREIESTTDEVAALVESEKEARREYAPQLREIESAIEEAERTDRRVEELRRGLEDAERTRDERANSLDQQRDRLADLREALDTLDAEIAEREPASDDGPTEIEHLRVERETVGREIDRLESRIADLEADRERLATAREDVETLSTEIASITELIENRERELREAFNEAMDDLLEALSFERIERVWLDGAFEVVVAREVDGAVREDALAHLAESEREMIGLVLGLAGYLAYDVESVAPVVVLDSLGAFDVERTARLVEYFADRTPFLLAAVHPEQAEALPFEQRSLESERVAS